MDRAVINITESFCFGNKAGYAGGVLFTQIHTQIVISDTNISQNSAHKYGALWVNDNSMLELNGSVVEGNHAEIKVGAFFISNNSLLVAFNSTFKGNRAYQDSSLRFMNSTGYLENCTFVENRMTYFGGTISTHQMTKLKVSNTVFTQNEGYNLFIYAERTHFINTFETHRCLFVRGNIFLKSNVKNFEEVAVKEKVIGQLSFLNQNYLASRETPYASSKIFNILNIYEIAEVYITL